MKLLLDTKLLLWAAASPAKLPLPARKLLKDPQNELIFSAASLWEVAIKSDLGRKDFQVDVSLLRRGLLDNGYQELAISSAHAVAVKGLPRVHGIKVRKFIRGPVFDDCLTAEYAVR